MKIQFIFVLLLLLGVPLIAVPEENTFIPPRKTQVITAEANGGGMGKSEIELRMIQRLATLNAENDAEASINKPMWLFLGCVPGIGLLSALVYNPPVPISRFIGNSSEYIVVYTEAYKRKMKALQFGFAFAGCITGGIVGGGALLTIYSSGGFATE